jgi:outer membrane protein assembly factor BamD (BamD/ComL family)
LREESELVRQARAKLREGDGAGALRVLEGLDRRFGPGGLGEERAVLAVEALAAIGQGPRAAARAEAVLREHPASPYAERLRRVIERARRGSRGGP